jgi:rhodanese-related sulfurtransferase
VTDVSQVEPQDLAPARQILIIDIRPLGERFDGLGFIPGSLCVPAASIGSGARAAFTVPPMQPVALACLTGRRSFELAVSIAATRQPGTTFNLAGGLMRWRTSGLPVAGLDARLNLRDRDPSADLSATCREMAACFMAEAVELSLDAGLDVDPMQLFNQCCAQAGVNPDAPELLGLVRALDLVASRSRELGNDHDRIAENIDGMLTKLGLVAPPAAATGVA